MSPDPEPQPLAHGGLVAAACAVYLAILGSSLMTFASPLAGSRVRTLGFFTIGLILLECAIVSALCLIVDRRHPRAGLTSLATAVFVWILGIHFWITLYALVPEAGFAPVSTLVLAVGHACAIATWLISAVLGSRSLGALAGRSAAGLAAVATAAMGVLAALMGLSAAL